MGSMRRRGTRILLFWVVARILGGAATDELLHEASSRASPETSVTVSTGAQFAATLRNTSVTLISLRPEHSSSPNTSYHISLQRQDLDQQGTILIGAGRSVLITSDGPAVRLDFGAMPSVIMLEPNSSVTFNNVDLGGYASPHSVHSTGQLPVVPGFSCWPTITAGADSKFAFVNSTTRFLSDDCSRLLNLAQGNPSQAGFVSTEATSVVTFGPQDAAGAVVLQNGVHVKHLLVENGTTQANVGEMLLEYENTVTICTNDPLGPNPPAAAGPAAGSHAAAPAAALPQVWHVAVATVGAAAGGALIAALAVLACRGCCWRRGRRTASADVEPGGLQAAGTDASKAGSKALHSSQGSGPPEGAMLAEGCLRDGAAGALGAVWEPAGAGGAGTAGGTGALRWLGLGADQPVEVGPLIARGSYGRVYKGRWCGALVAIKAIEHLEVRDGGGRDSCVDQRIARETLLSTQLSHPNVIATHQICTVRLGAGSGVAPGGAEEPGGAEDAGRGGAASPSGRGKADDAPASPAGPLKLLETWLVMEYADRGSLSAAISSGVFHRKGPDQPDLFAICRCLIDIATGLQYLHGAGIIHGDLKNANVLLKSTTSDVRGFICKLADFGLSRVVDLRLQTHISTQTYGTLTCMGPEVLSQSRITYAADVYSFGILMWELLTAKSAFEGMSLGQVYYAVVYEDARPEVPPPPRCPPAYAALLRATWARDAAARPTIAEVCQQLRALYRVERAKDPARGMAPASTFSAPA